MAAELSAAGGIITAEDLNSAAPAVREPLRVQVGAACAREGCAHRVRGEL